MHWQTPWPRAVSYTHLDVYKRQSWCGPCIDEMPELQRFANSQGAAGTQVIGLALDTPEAIKDFLTRVPVDYPIPVSYTHLDVYKRQRQHRRCRGGTRHRTDCPTGWRRPRNFRAVWRNFHRRNACRYGSGTQHTTA